ncbi:hypothetical protein [Thiomonas sp. FB-Cd]|uniref:hypothetical protein n=1 Tax=Thiomonas sp. FB-Cd TaxID=1158292 RepID=UPI0018CC0CB2|nr:hypothetical protein [Thiomonas sp. FB-Cd]
MPSLQACWSVAAIRASRPDGRQPGKAQRRLALLPSHGVALDGVNACVRTEPDAR